MRKLIAPMLAAAMVITGCSTPPPPHTIPVNPLDNVAIIVIDDFHTVGETRSNPRSDRNCTYEPESTNDVSSHGAGDGLPPGVSHGEVVYARLAKELEDTSGLETLPTNANEDGRWKYHGKQIVLTKLDTASFDTTELASRIQAEVDALAAGPDKFRRFVLNMSFVIAPCNVPKWLRDHGLLSTDRVIELYRGLVEAVPELSAFRDTLEALARSASPEIQLTADDDGLGPIRRLLAVSLFYELVEQRNDAAVSWIQSDSLKGTINLLRSSANKVISVGAAGNGIWVLGKSSESLVRKQLPFPFAPGLWNPVVSTSASDEDPQTRADYSNSGEVLLDGRTSAGTTNVHGTSFAAPRLSAQEAVYLFTGGETTCASNIPPLGYTNSDLGGQTWQNLEVAAAAAGYCPAFLRWL